MIRIFLIIVVVAVVAAVLVLRRGPTDPNILAGMTTNQRAWSIGRYGKTDAHVSIEQDALRIDSLAIDDSAYHLTVFTGNIPLNPAHRYLLSFSIKADSRRTIFVRGDQGGYGGNFGEIGLEDTVLLDKEWTNHEVTFKPKGMKVSHPVTMPIFNVGDKVGTVWIKNIYLEALD